MANFPRVIGAIDGTHIEISAPRQDKEAYYNRKKYYSILLQGIVNADKKFIDVHCGEPGSMHDARLFRKSNFYRAISVNRNLIITGGVLLGDSAYPELEYLVPPYKDFGNLTSKERKFNNLHSATRVVVENAFGLLKCRFRRLKFFESPCIGFISKCVIAACVLHNICVEENDEDESDDYGGENLENEEQSNTVSEERLDGIRRQIFLELDNRHFLD